MVAPATIAVGKSPGVVEFRRPSAARREGIRLPAAARCRRGGWSESEVVTVVLFPAAVAVEAGGAVDGLISLCALGLR